MDPYAWVVFLHVAFVLLFTLAHGISAAVGLRLRSERDRARIAALLDLSRVSLIVTFVGLLGVLVTGIAAGVMGGWFAVWWPWVSLVLFVVVGGLMTPLGRGYLDQVRAAVGAEVARKDKDEPPVAPVSDAELDALLRSRRPLLAAVTGGVGLIVLLWLMMLKPF